MALDQPRASGASAAISTVGFLASGCVYLQFDAAYIVERGIDKGMYQELFDNADAADGARAWTTRARTSPTEVKELRELRNGPERNAENAPKLEEEVDKWRADALAAWQKLDAGEEGELADARSTVVDLTPRSATGSREYGHDVTEETRFDLTLAATRAGALPRPARRRAQLSRRAGAA